MTENVKHPNVVDEFVANTADPAEGAQPLQFTLTCGDQYVAYESLFHNTRVTGTLVLQVSLSGNVRDCTFRVTAERCGQDPIIREIQPTADTQSISLTVDNLRKITFSASGAGGAEWVGEYTLLLQWCKSC